MQKFNTLGDVIALAEFAHRNQRDKAGMPYIDHPKRVLATVQAMGARPYVQMAAVLHDVTEDTAFTVDMLIELGISEAAVELVKLLDRDYSLGKFASFVAGHGNVIPPGLSQDEDEFYYRQIKNNPDALLIKVADIRDNLAPWRQSYLSEQTQERLRIKYAKALDSLGVTL